MQHWIRRTAGALALSVVCAGQAASETLADALVSAYTHSGLLDQNRALLRAADEDVAIAVSALRPVINWSASFGRTLRRSNSIQTGFVTSNSASTDIEIALVAELTLIDFGANRLAIDAAKESVLATRERLISVEQQVLLRAVRAFMNVQREAENVALRQNNLRLLRQERRAAQDRFNVGEVTRTDVSLAEARLASAESLLASSIGALDQAREEYAAVVGHPPGHLVAPRSLPKTASSEDAAKAIAVRTHPDMREAQRNVTVAELNILRAEAQTKPTVSLQGRIGASESAPRRNAQQFGSISLEASGPVYQGGRLPALIRQAAANRDATRGALHNVRHAVRLNVGTAWSQVAVAQASRRASQAQIRAARVAFEGVREEAKLGARTTLDVLDAEQELLNARASEISAAVDEYIAAYTLLSAMGLLTVEHLNLPVQQYDPAAYYNLVKDAPGNSLQGQKLDRVLKALGKQ
ncbi:TolC family outer membrane protein [Pseudaestuariivita atlantica]|uniref:Transporter n=1 Tax=Pseudaestuariivita atlantica TaxID=1317121 RepID=A0A0L1JLU7_9RHOB|nr:TolC family outer membrane protein [Pseudaestuariivita atlantica]KNG92729.1 transporter [Pseudaestuariivita atlantica]